MPGKFEIRTSSNSQFYFNLMAGNGEPILTSETYWNKSDARNGIDSVKTHAPFDSSYERKSAANGEFYFVLRAINGKTIGRSEGYRNWSGMENGIEAVKKNAPGAAVADLA
ncbi:MAG TPA: YegP family protein [Thermoanaerobaculia bacterium]|nr:YegP family protein [Thermoanaerobaculia bacterium]